jgi:signal transduction histidine kinase
MRDRPLSSLERSRGEGVLFIVLVIASYVITFAPGTGSFTALQIGVLVAVGIAYTLTGLYGDAICKRWGSTWGAAAYLGMQIVLGSTIYYLSDTRAWLILLPAAGQAVEWLPRRWMLLMCGLILAAMVALGALFMLRFVGPEGERVFTLRSADFWLNLLQWVLAYGAALAFVVLFTQVAVRERLARAEVERLAVELREANRQLREYATQAEELATLKERNRLAREIHDGLGHYLTAINMQIQAGRAVVEHDRELGFQALEKAQALAQDGLAEVRRSVSSLRASPLDQRSLPQAVGDLVDECRAAGIATEYAVLGQVRALSPQVELTLYRVAQEGMTNMRKHAQASSAEVVLNYRGDGWVHLAVRDGGIGAEDPSGGYGLVGIRERVQLLRGQVQIETAPGEGFALLVRVPGDLVF